MPANPEDLAHLLRRCGYLTTPALLAQWSTLELDQAVNRVLDFSANQPDSSFGFVTAPGDWQRLVQLRRWWLDRMAFQPAPLQEKLTFFWHGHFATSYSKVSNAELMLNQNRIFRKYAVGSFHDMAQAVSVDPAMIMFLDGQDNRKGSPNENFARESMELFTMGVNQGYTQTDVAEVARAWTGHGVHWYGNNVAETYEFRPTWHDTGLKTIFGETKNWNGPDVITAIVNGQRQPVCARFIARKLWSFFAYPNPDEGLLGALANAFVASGMQIGPLVRFMLLRPEFYSAEAKLGLVRTPVEFGVKLHQITGRSFTETDVDYTLGDMGQLVLEPPNVSGWKQNEFWITENTVWLKDEAVKRVAWRAINAGFLSEYASLTNAQLVQRVLDLFGLSTVLSSTRAALDAWVSVHRGANAGELRYHLLRLVALTPEFGLA
jgi:uncharacterized protein (DUF1800 family)